MRICRLAILTSCITVGLHAQAMIEYSLGAARGGLAGATGANKTGKSIGAVFDKTGKAVEKAGQTAAPAAKSKAPTAAAKAEPPADAKPTEQASNTTSVAPKKAAIRISQ